MNKGIVAILEVCFRLAAYKASLSPLEIMSPEQSNCPYLCRGRVDFLSECIESGHDKTIKNAPHRHVTSTRNPAIYDILEPRGRKVQGCQGIRGLIGGGLRD
jgi:hypothetical protein